MCGREGDVSLSYFAKRLAPTRLAKKRRRGNTGSGSGHESGTCKGLWFEGGMDAFKQAIRQRSEGRVFQHRQVQGGTQIFFHGLGSLVYHTESNFVSVQGKQPSVLYEMIQDVVMHD